MQKIGKSYRLPYNPTNVQTKQKSSATSLFFQSNLKFFTFRIDAQNIIFDHVNLNR